MIWTTLKEMAAVVTAEPAQLGEGLDAALQGELAEDHPHRRFFLGLAWMAFRFAPERSAGAALEVPLLRELLVRGDKSLDDFIEGLMPLCGGDPLELDDLAFGPEASVVAELEEARRRPVLRRREAALDAVMCVIAGEPLPAESDLPAILIEATGLVRNQPSRAAALALRCAADPSLSTAQLALALGVAGWAHDVQEADAQAMQHFRASLEVAYNPFFGAKLGGLVHDREDPDAGREMVRRALGEGHPMPATGYAMLGFIEGKRGELRLAERAYGHALAHASDLPEARAERCLLRVDLDDYEGALRDARRAVELGDAVGYQLLANVEMQRGELDAALAAADRFIAHGGEGHVLRAAIHLARGDLPAAEADCTRDLSLTPPVRPIGHLLRARVRTTREDWVGAIEDVTPCLEPDVWSWVATQTRSLRLLEIPFDTREGGQRWRASLLAKLLPAEPVLGELRATLEAGDAKAGLQQLAALIATDDPEARAIAKTAALPLLRALGNDAELREELRDLRMGL